MFLEIAYGVAAASASVTAWAVRGRSATLLAPSVWRGPSDKKAIALTFDDGPSHTTPQILDELEKHKARCTFFQIGRNVERLPEVARQVVERGHEVANHTYSHAPLYFRHKQFLDDELSLAQEAIQQHTGVTCELFRAPFGARWFGLGEAQQRHQLMGVMWGVNSLDWKSKAKAIHKTLKSGARNGAIMLLHDGRELAPRPDVSQTLEALGRLLPELREQGYHLVTVSELLCRKQHSNASSASS